MLSETGTALCSKFHFPPTYKNILYTMNTILFCKTEEYEGFLVVKYHCIRKTYCLNLQRRALLSVIFTLKTYALNFF